MLMGRGSFAHGILATQFRAQGKSQHRCVLAEENFVLEGQ
jgi:hypothetical protein